MSLITKEIPISQIHIGKRLREDIGNISSLCSSISSIGLLHPIIVTSDYHLVAGQRRLAAVKQLGWENIPVRILDFQIGETEND